MGGRSNWLSLLLLLLLLFFGLLLLLLLIFGLFEDKIVSGNNPGNNGSRSLRLTPSTDDIVIKSIRR
jgi:hypothetical protein